MLIIFDAIISIHRAAPFERPFYFALKRRGTRFYETHSDTREIKQGARVVHQHSETALAQLQHSGRTARAIATRDPRRASTLDQARRSDRLSRGRDQVAPARICFCRRARVWRYDDCDHWFDHFESGTHRSTRRATARFKM